MLRSELVSGPLPSPMYRPNPRDPLAGKVIHGTYRVVRRIGSGSMGLVHEVEHLRLGRRFALKTLQPQLAERPDVVRRFHREARAAAAIGHSGIVQVTDMGVLETGEPFLVMELLQGRSLRDEISAVGPLTTVRSLDIAIGCCDALAAAHSKAIVHRDLKPDNIFLVQSAGFPERVKLLDFGISKFLEASVLLGEPATRTGVLLGTPYYMSPEQLRGAPTIDQRTDVYSMGVVVFEMLTGGVPYKAPSLADLAMAVLTGPQPSIEEHAPGASKELAAIIRRAMAIDPQVRTPSIATLGQELTEVAAQYRTETGERKAPPPPAEPRRRRASGRADQTEPTATADGAATSPGSAPNTISDEVPADGDPTEIAAFAFDDVDASEPARRSGYRTPPSGENDVDDDQPTTVLVSSDADYPVAARAPESLVDSAPAGHLLPPLAQTVAMAPSSDARLHETVTLPIRASRGKLARTLVLAFGITIALTVATTLLFWSVWSR